MNEELHHLPSGARRCAVARNCSSAAAGSARLFFLPRLLRPRPLLPAAATVRANAALCTATATL